jgi:chromosome segregation ATPase
MDELEQRYQTLHANYERLIASGDATAVSQIESLNKQLSDVIAQMLQKVADVKDGSENIEKYRADLLQKLVRIQHDHNSLATTHDKIETLRRIRNDQQANFDGAFFGYAVGLFISCVILFFVILFKGGQRAAANPAMASSAMMTPPLMYRGV